MSRLSAIAIIIAAACVGLFSATMLTSQPQNVEAYHTTYSAPYISQVVAEPALDTLQCPIPRSCRVRNYTGIQCVYASIEMLGRWAEEPKLTQPPLTSRSECKGYSGPFQLANVLNNLEVRYEYSYLNKERGIALIEKAMAEGRGCLFGVPGHAMVLVHYDEEANRVCWVDNSDQGLRVQTMTVDAFMQRWDTWVCVIYADNDIIPYKLGRGPNLIPIYDWINPNRAYEPGDLIVQPMWR